MAEIRRIEIPELQVLADTGDILPMDIGGLFVHGQQKINIFHDLAVGELDFGEAGELRTQPAHILFSQKQGIMSLFHLRRQIAHMDGGPHAPGRGQGNVKRVLADHPDGRHADLDRAGAVVRAAEHQIRVDLFSLDEVFIRQLGEDPDLLAVTQAPGGFIRHPFAQQGIGKGKGFVILYDLVAVGHDAEDFPVALADVCFVAGDDAAIGENRLLLHHPVEAGQLQSIPGIEGFPDTDAETVPRCYADIEHCFNICGH